MLTFRSVSPQALPGRSLPAAPQAPAMRFAAAPDRVTFSGQKKNYEKLTLQSWFPVELINSGIIGENIFALCNPAAIDDGHGGVHMLLRGIIGDQYPDPPFTSVLYYAHSPDGITIRDIRAAILPDDKFRWGFEDPRITKQGDTYHIICTGYDGKVPQMNHWTTKNFKSFNYEGIIGPVVDGQPVDDKDGLLMQKKLRVNEGGRIVKSGGKEKIMVLHRIPPDIQYVLADDFDQMKDPAFWAEQMRPENLAKNTMLPARPGTWEHKMGSGPVPFETPDGWLMIYHASDENRVYRAGVALLDKNDPRKVIAKSPDPILEPTLDFEKRGPVINVVFPQGTVIRPGQDGRDNVYIYYGAADKNIGLTTVPVDDLLAYVKQFDAKGRVKRQPKA